ncbi:unnamed protein product, partial [Amoebophrya sp. A120]
AYTHDKTAELCDLKDRSLVRDSIAYPRADAWVAASAAEKEEYKRKKLECRKKVAACGDGKYLLDSATKYGDTVSSGFCKTYTPVVGTARTKHYPCSASCAPGGLVKETRHVRVFPKNGGHECPTELERFRPCNTHVPCPPVLASHLQAETAPGTTTLFGSSVDDSASQNEAQTGPYDGADWGPVSADAVAPAGQQQESTAPASSKQNNRDSAPIPPLTRQGIYSYGSVFGDSDGLLKLGVELAARSPRYRADEAVVEVKLVPQLDLLTRKKDAPDTGMARPQLNDLKVDTLKFLTFDVHEQFPAEHANRKLMEQQERHAGKEGHEFYVRKKAENELHHQGRHTTDFSSGSFQNNNDNPFHFEHAAAQNEFSPYAPGRDFRAGQLQDADYDGVRDVYEEKHYKVTEETNPMAGGYYAGDPVLDIRVVVPEGYTCEVGRADADAMPDLDDETRKTTFNTAATTPPSSSLAQKQYEKIHTKQLHGGKDDGTTTFVAGGGEVSVGEKTPGPAVSTLLAERLPKEHLSSRKDSNQQD